MFPLMGLAGLGGGLGGLGTLGGFGGALGGIGGMLGGLFGGGGDGEDAYNNAADAQVQAAIRANEEYQKYLEQAQGLQKNTYGEGRSDIQGGFDKSLGYTQPYRDAGKQALDYYSASLGMNPNISQDQIIKNFQNTPGYQFATNEAIKSLDKSAAARGLAQSGGHLRALTERVHGLADERFGQYQNRLAELANQGAGLSQQVAQNQIGTGNALANRGMHYADAASNLYNLQGTSAAESQLAQGQARAGGYLGAANAAAQRQGANAGIGSIFGSMLGKGDNPFGSALSSIFGGKNAGTAGGLIGGVLGGLF